MTPSGKDQNKSQLFQSASLSRLSEPNTNNGSILHDNANRFSQPSLASSVVITAPNLFPLTDQKDEKIGQQSLVNKLNMHQVAPASLLDTV